MFIYMYMIFAQVQHTLSLFNHPDRHDDDPDYNHHDHHYHDLDDDDDLQSICLPMG